MTAPAARPATPRRILDAAAGRAPITPAAYAALALAWSRRLPPRLPAASICSASYAAAWTAALASLPPGHVLRALASARRSLSATASSPADRAAVRDGALYAAAVVHWDASSRSRPSAPSLRALCREWIALAASAPPAATPAGDAWYRARAAAAAAVLEAAGVPRAAAADRMRPRECYVGTASRRGRAPRPPSPKGPLP